MIRSNDPEVTRSRSLSWSDLERLKVIDPESDPDQLFAKRPEVLKDPISDLEDSESLSLFLSYGRKISRLSRSDRRLSGLRI